MHIHITSQNYLAFIHENILLPFKFWGGDDDILRSVPSKILKTSELTDNLLTKEYQLILSVSDSLQLIGKAMHQL